MLFVIPIGVNTYARRWTRRRPNEDIGKGEAGEEIENDWAKDDIEYDILDELLIMYKKDTDIGDIKTKEDIAKNMID